MKKWNMNRLRSVMYFSYAIILLLALHGYIIWQSVNVILGAIALPLVATVQAKNKSRVLYGMLALFFAFISLLLPVKTLLYFAIACACFFVTETSAGKMNLLPVAVAILMSPVFQFVANVFSFPIRMWLTAVAGECMHMAGMQTVVKGNLILYHGNEFSVDPACMGLNMLVASLLLQIILIAVYERKYLLRLKSWHTPALLMMAFLLNLFCNLFRIICLVWFNIQPGTMLHELMGLICFSVYVIVPSVFVTKWLVKRTGRNWDIKKHKASALPGNRFVTMHTLVLLAVASSAWAVMQHDARMNDQTAAVAPVTGYSVQRVAADIIKLQNDHCLVYIKHISGFYNADHNPMICWRGSGYIFRQVQKQTFNGRQVYTAVLQNGNDQLYTAWWYGNGSAQTIEQVSWRWDVLTGAKPYSLVNVTAGSEQELTKEVNAIIGTNRFRSLL